jgi:hypothetical protein
MSKTRTDAKLKTLPADVQAALWSFFEEDAKRKLEDAVPWLMSEHNVATDFRRVSEWRLWYARKLEIESAQSEAEEIKEALALAGQYSAKQLEQVGNLIFLNRATKEGDAKVFAQVANVLQGRESMEAKATQHEDKMKVANKRLELQSADMQRKLKELEMKVAEFEKAKAQAEKEITKAGNTGGMSPEAVAALRSALGWTPPVEAKTNLQSPDAAQGDPASGQKTTA